MRICITRSEKKSYSETFIRDQIAGLSTLAKVYTIHSGRLPEKKEDGSLLAPLPIWILHKIVRTLTGRRNNYFGNYGVKKYLRENNIEAVLANYGLAAAHLTPICSDLGIPLIVIFHGHDATDRKLVNAYTHKYKQLFEYASSVIVVSQDMCNKIVALGADPAKVRVIPCGVNIDKFAPSTARKEKTFLAVGRFVNKKGPQFTIHAFHEVWKRFPEAKLIMVGAYAGLYSDCERLVNALDMKEAVSFPGILAQDQVRELMTKVYAFVQHSVVAPNGDMEGTPVSILEASASELPVISTFHGGIKDAVIHCQTGFLVKEGDISEMAAYMGRLLSDSELATSMGKEGRIHIQRNYNQANQIQKLFELADQACDQAIEKKSMIIPEFSEV